MASSKIENKPGSVMKKVIPKIQKNLLLDLKATKIKHKDKPYSEALQNIQGNILKGHDRNEAILFLLKFVGDPKAVKKQIAKFAKMDDLGTPGTVTSASLQLEEFELYRNHQVPGGTFVNFFLTSSGYDYLGFTKVFLKDKKARFDEKFMNGMQNSKELNDPDPRFWDNHYQKPKDIHALLLIADDEESILGQKVRIILRDVLKNENKQKMAEIIGVEHANQLRDGQELPIEHFGFRDGISNPYFLKSDEETVAYYGGDKNWKPWAPLGLALVPDPLFKDGYGSYLVLRKLEQHVRLFETIIRTFAANTLGLNSGSEEDLEQARALLMGRFRDGTPLTRRNSSYLSRYGNENYNNFNYENDSVGTKCPFHAHIRKMNPRDDHQGTDKKYQGTEKNEGNKMDRRIVRRGMTYGVRNKQREDQGLSFLPNNSIGLLFMCFQSDIGEQFEYLQKQMANNVDFPEKRTGLDPIAGQFDTNSSSPPPPQEWPLPWGEGEKRFLNAIQSSVTLKGGEYFFAPSISFLKNIDQI